MGELTYAQEDALARLKKKHREAPGVLVHGKDELDRLEVMLPGTESARRRRRFITPTGIVERAT